MKRILFTLFALFVTVNLAHGQAWYYAGVDSYVAFDIPTTWPYDSSGVNLSKYNIQAYIVRGYEGTVSCPDSFGNGGEYLVRWPIKWNRGDGHHLINRTSNTGIMERQLTCGNEMVLSFSIDENANTGHNRSLLLRLLQENPSNDSWKEAYINFHLVDSADDLPEDASSGSGPLPLFRKSTVSSEKELPNAISLKQNYPNPFNPQTTITYQIDSPQHVRLDVFNAQGQRIQTLVDGVRAVGEYSIRFDAGGLPSGLYAYRLQTSGETRVRKMMLVR